MSGTNLRRTSRKTSPCSIRYEEDGITFVVLLNSYLIASFLNVSSPIESPYYLSAIDWYPPIIKIPPAILLTSPPPFLQGDITAVVTSCHLKKVSATKWTNAWKSVQDLAPEVAQAAQGAWEEASEKQRKEEAEQAAVAAKEEEARRMEAEKAAVR